MRHLDLFSGIGGFALAAEWAGFETVGFSEVDEFCIKVLKKHWPEVKNYGDVRITENFRELAGTIDILTGGFPCQPFSIAGPKLGKADHRNIWPSMLDLIKLIQPTWVIGENVVNFANMVLASCQDDLESAGYKSQSFDIPAAACGLSTVERHVWVIAEDNSPRMARDQNANANKSPSECNGARIHDLPSGDITGWNGSEPKVLRTRKGVPNCAHRIRAIGNAFNPQVAFEIFEAIKKAEAEFDATKLKL